MISVYIHMNILRKYDCESRKYQIGFLTLPVGYNVITTKKLKIYSACCIAVGFGDGLREEYNSLTQPTTTMAGLDHCHFPNTFGMLHLLPH